MASSIAKWKVKDRQKLLLKLLNQANESSSISFEGDLGDTKLDTLNGVSKDETAVMKRNTVHPRQEFIIVPLDRNSPEFILRALGGTVPRAVLHIQIAEKDSLIFAACDNFQHVVFGNNISASILDGFAADGIIQPAS